MEKLKMDQSVQLQLLLMRQTAHLAQQKLAAASKQAEMDLQVRIRHHGENMSVLKDLNSMRGEELQIHKKHMEHFEAEICASMLLHSPSIHNVVCVRVCSCVCVCVCVVISGGGFRCVRV
jgi:hypothetical protein